MPRTTSIASGARARKAPTAVATPLPPLKAQPYREHVAEDGAEAGEGRKNVNRVRTVIGNIVGIMAGEEEHMGDGQVSLEGVKQKRCDGQSLGTGASDVGGADVAAAGLAHVLTAKNADEQISERDRAEQIRNDDDDERVGQRDSWFVVGGNRRAKVACFS